MTAHVHPDDHRPRRPLTGEASLEAPIVCALFGASSPLTPAELARLYPTQDDYLAKFDAALDAAITAGSVRDAARDAYTAEGHTFTVATG